MPPSPPSVVALASAQVAVELLASNDPIVVAPQPVRDVLGNEDIQFESFNNLVDVLSEPDEPTPVKSWPVFDHSRYAPPKGEEERIRNNLQAIELAKELLATGAIPDDAQRHQLLSYAGWGGLARLFEEHSKNPWSAHRDHLKSLLTEEEFDSARSTVTDAFYTDAVLVGAMWETLRRMGFQGGSVIEPMAGTGLFLAGMPAALAQVCEVTAIEKDTVSGAVLRAAFAGTDLRAQIQPLERARLPHGFYDVAIGNLAFGDIKVADPRKVGYASFSIHNWAIAKCIDLVRPGGIVAMITSRHTLDSRTDTHRLWFNSQAELLGAVRLPQGAFKRHAGTDVVADTGAATADTATPAARTSTAAEATWPWPSPSISPSRSSSSRGDSGPTASRSSRTRCTTWAIRSRWASRGISTACRARGARLGTPTATGATRCSEA